MNDVALCAGSVWSLHLWHSRHGGCWHHVRPQEELLRDWGWRPPLSLHHCSWARWALPPPSIVQCTLVQECCGFQCGFSPSGLCKASDILFLLDRTRVQHAPWQREGLCGCVRDTAGKTYDVSHPHSDQPHQPLVPLQRCHYHWIPWQRPRWVSTTPDPCVWPQTVWWCDVRGSQSMDRHNLLLTVNSSDSTHQSCLQASGSFPIYSNKLYNTFCGIIVKQMFQCCHLSQHQLGLKTFVGVELQFDTSLAQTIMRNSGRGWVALLLI